MQRMFDVVAGFIGMLVLTLMLVGGYVFADIAGMDVFAMPQNAQAQGQEQEQAPEAQPEAEPEAEPEVEPVVTSVETGVALQEALAAFDGVSGTGSAAEADVSRPEAELDAARVRASTITTDADTASERVFQAYEQHIGMLVAEHDAMVANLRAAQDNYR